MNWYYEDNGIAQGPVPESELESRVRGQKLSAEALIWAAGSAEWRSVKDLRPVWLEVPKVTAQPASPRAKDTPLVKRGTASDAKTSSAPEPGMKLKAKATEAPAPEVPAEKPGLLKRLFGLGKKK
jgi:hypothetical protein